MARPHALANAEFTQQVAECLVAGMTRKEMCDILGVSDPQTITRWRKDPRVQNLVIDMIRNRVIEITRKTDAVIAQRLQKPEDLTTREIIDIRREYMGDKLRQQTEDVDVETINEAQKYFDEHPDAAEQMRKLLEGGTLPAAEPE